jgi:cupin 2 domain-containing protein
MAADGRRREHSRRDAEMLCREAKTGATPPASVAREPMQLQRGNLFEGAIAPPGGERETLLASGGGTRIVRIFSAGHASPPGFWYESADAEWVALLAGSATLAFADDAEPVALAPGDHVLIPAGRRHRIAQTDPDRSTVWLAVHFRTEP